jgi:3-oxoacyl-[acyl-carrier-protein] synthase-3
MRIVGVGSAIPEDDMSNTEIEARLDLEPGWIERRTGIRRRPTATLNEATSDLAVRAAEAALRQSSRALIDRSSIGLVLLATSTPDHLLPPTAPLVAHRLGLRAGAVDLAGACSGFVYALVFAGQWVQGSGKPALVIGANVLTRRVNPMDAATVSLFSDGAGALVLAPHQPTTLLGSYLGSDGSAYETIGIPDGGSRTPFTVEALREGRNLMTMRRGSALFKQAVQGMAQAGKFALESAALRAGDIDLWIPHQANRRIIEDVGALLSIPAERTVNVVSNYGNSSAATIPIAMAEAAREGRLKDDQTVLLTAAGAGLITAGVVLRWRD